MFYIFQAIKIYIMIFQLHQAKVYSIPFKNSLEILTGAKKYILRRM